MAETTKKADNATKKVTVRLPLVRGQNAVQEEFFSLNCKNYRIKRGETVEIPEELEEVITNAQLADEYAMRFVDQLTEAENNKKTELGIK